MTVRGAVFLGIGAMVGAGIFAFLGEAGDLAGVAVWISFLLAGLVSPLLGYAMAKMGIHYPSSGGLITYLIQGFGNGRLVGSPPGSATSPRSWSSGPWSPSPSASMAAPFVGDNNAVGWDQALRLALVVVTMFRVNHRRRAPSTGPSRSSSPPCSLVFAIFVVVTLTHLDPHLLASADTRRPGPSSRASR